MKIKCNKSDLVNAMKIILKAIPKRTTNPYLECVLIEAESDLIRLTSNDMELAINTILDGSADELGTAAIDANMLSNIAQKLPNGAVSISVETGGASAVIKGGKSKFTIPCKDADNFIGMPPIQGGVEFTMSQEELREMIFAVAFCSDMGSQTAMMQGCNMEVEGDTIKICALDGHRIGLRNAKIRNIVDKTRATIPTKALIELAKTLTSGEVSVTLTKMHVIFRFNDTVVLSRLIEGDYFKYEQVFKSQSTTTVFLSASDFGDCVNRSTVLLREGDKKPLVLEISDNNMHLKTESNIGTANEDLEIEKQGDDLRVGYNPRFLLDVLNAIDHDNIEIRMCGAKGPAIFAEDGGNYMYVILPVNL